MMLPAAEGFRVHPINPALNLKDMTNFSNLLQKNSPKKNLCPRFQARESFI
jgi:hypothetical protein